MSDLLESEKSLSDQSEPVVDVTVDPASEPLTASDR